ncbi:uncharacterized protein LOC130621447 [Hydractinia symbiolongicarpus]|uniref:uncharacterized protein LOC130621447 n=1 Tax=Hydractinia symbiolongicarpus TaxID=13093 RepID=UPI00254DDC31|nr:uncharacterized protein LOC130621447 [Hydractinia symbiolongicarpus]
MSQKKSQSTIYREKGNKYYLSSQCEGISPCLQLSRLKDSLLWYEKAKHASSKQDERSSAAKNIAVASKRIGVFMSERNNSVRERHYYFKEALSNFDLSYRFGQNKDPEWINKLLVSYRETLQQAIDDISLLEFEQKMLALRDYAECILNASHIHSELLLEIASMRFHYGISSFNKKDYKTCLYQMQECYRPIEEARRHGRNHTYVIVEANVMEQDIFLNTCVAESAQVRLKADDVLHSLLMDEENLSMDMVWKVVDLYKEAIILTREKDVEMEAIALSRLGNVYDKILKDKLKAKAYFRRSIQLALSLHPRIFDAEDWYKDCHNVLERYQQEVVKQEADEWNNDRKSYVEELKDTIREVEKIKERGDEPFLKHIYRHHPPLGRNCTLGEFPCRGSDMFRTEMKQLFRTAVIHYHPDRVDAKKEGKKIKVLMEEIHKLLTQRYESYK